MDIVNLVLAVISVLLTVLGLLQGWQIFTIKAMLRSIDKLGEKDDALGGDLKRVEVLVAAAYVTRVEFHQAMRDQTATIVATVNRVHERLDGASSRS